MERFKYTLLEISNKLSSDNVVSLKFLCADKIGKKKTEEVENGLQLFDYLIQREIIGHDNTEHLRELLDKIGRQDLLGIIDTYEGQADPAELPDEAELEKISIATNVIVDNLGKKWKEFGRKLPLSDAKLDGIEEKHPRNLEEKVREVIKEWKKMRKGQAKVDELIKALRACSQNFTADVVEKALQNASTP
ncbi:hypothetical protein SRHO_G00169220 [Serrasalmus rhombeus]